VIRHARPLLIVTAVVEGILLALMAGSFAILVSRTISQQASISCESTQVGNLLSVLAIRTALSDQSRQAQLTWSAAQAADAQGSVALRSAGLIYVVTTSRIDSELAEHPVPALEHCLPGCWPSERKRVIRRFTCYRPNPPAEYYQQGTANPPDEPQFEGAVFSDGSVAVRWLTQFRSTSIWNSWADLEQVHGHPEYGTYITWHDAEPDTADPDQLPLFGTKV
jgi:hypothetical protein